MQLLDLEIEERPKDPGCYDWLKLHEMEESIRMDYCGTLETMIPETQHVFNHLEITFIADSMNAFRGFLLKYERKCM